MLVLFLVLYIISYVCCRYYSLVFNGRRRFLEAPAQLKKEIYISSRSSQLHAWYDLSYPGRPLLLYFHGNNLNISYRSYVTSLAKLLQINYLLADYSGFGKSGGYSNLSTFYSDSLAIYQQARSQGLPIILWGESLGGHAAAYCASLHPPEYLVLFSTFARLSQLVAGFSWIPDMNSLRFLQDYPGKACVIHSREDSLISFSQAQKNYASLKRGTFIEIEGDHLNPLFSVQSFYALLDFLELEHSPLTETEEWIRSTQKGLFT